MGSNDTGNQRLLAIVRAATQEAQKVKHPSQWHRTFQVAVPLMLALMGGFGAMKCGSWSFSTDDATYHRHHRAVE